MELKRGVSRFCRCVDWMGTGLLAIAIAYAMVFAPLALAAEGGLKADAIGQAAAEIQASGQQGEKCKDPELECPKCPEPKASPEQKPCPTCPTCPQSAGCPSLDSTAVLLNPARGAEAMASMEFLREHVKSFIESKRSNEDHANGLIENLEMFSLMYRELPVAAEALYLKAEILETRKEYNAKLVVLTKLLFEYPQSEFADKAVIGIRGLFIGKLKNDLKYDQGLTNGSREPKWADRYAKAIELLAAFKEKGYRPAMIREYDEFLSRYPRHPKADAMLKFKASALVDDRKYESASVALDRLVKLYPASPIRSKALFDLGLLYENELDVYDKAVKAYDRLVTDYPEGEETLQAYQRAAVLYDKKLDNPMSAIAALDAIVNKFPKQKASLDALLYMSTLYKDEKKYKESVETLNRLADMFKGEDSAVKALIEGARTASGSMKDYQLQIDVEGRIVEEYPNREEAVLALESMADTYERRVNDKAKAIATYQRLVDNYPNHRLAESAKKKIEKLNLGR